MDDIAARLKISKRTLYEIYQNKEDLLYEVVVLNDKRGLEKLEEFDKPGTNVINIIIHVFKLQTEEFSRINPVFLEDIGKYPKLMEYIQNKRKRKRKQVVAFIERGISEGVFPARYKHRDNEHACRCFGTLHYEQQSLQQIQHQRDIQNCCLAVYKRYMHRERHKVA